MKWKHRQIIKPFKLFMQIKQGNKTTSEIARTVCLLGKECGFCCLLVLLAVETLGFKRPGGGAEIRVAEGTSAVTL